jgi:hypothetical protein
VTSLVLAAAAAPARLVGRGQYLGRLRARTHEKKAIGAATVLLECYTKRSLRAATIVIRSSNTP